MRYFGVLSSHARLREKVVATAGPGGALELRLREAAHRMDIGKGPVGSSGDSGEAGRPAGPGEFRHAFPYTWAMLLARIYEALPPVYPRCGSAMRIIAFIIASAEVKRILEHIGEPSEPPPLSPSRAPPQGELDFDVDTELEFNQDVNVSDAFEFDQETGEIGDTWE